MGRELDTDVRTGNSVTEAEQVDAIPEHQRQPLYGSDGSGEVAARSCLGEPFGSRYPSVSWNASI